MERFANWLARVVPGLGTLLIIILFVSAYFKYFDQGTLIPWIFEDQTEETIKTIQVLLTIFFVLLGAFLAYVRFFSYGFVFYRADTTLDVIVLPYSKECNIHFVKLKISNTGVAKLSVENFHYIARDFGPTQTEPPEVCNKELEFNKGKIHHQVVSRGETVDLLFAARFVDINSVVSSSYVATTNASGRAWFSHHAVSNRI
jgi:hypothetical protein